MTKKNTLSILESIKKKLNKFDEPKGAQTKNFSDLGDEFEYIDSAQEEKISAPDTIKQQIKELVNKPKAAEHDIILEHEIENSFPENDDYKEEIAPIIEEEHHEEISAQEENHEEEFKFSLEDVHDEFEEVKPAVTQNTASSVVNQEDDELFGDLDLEEESVLEPQEENSEDRNKAEEELFGDGHKEVSTAPKPAEAEVQEEEHHEEIARLLQQDHEEEHKESAEKHEDLDQLLAENDEKYLHKEKHEEEHLEDWANEHIAAGNKDDFNKATQNNERVNLATKSLLKQESAQKASESIKKLFDAKNAVSAVNSFTKSENMSEIAMQLLESRLEKWLNDNLPEIVERVVREEIEKIVPKE